MVGTIEKSGVRAVSHCFKWLFDPRGRVGRPACFVGLAVIGLLLLVLSVLFANTWSENVYAVMWVVVLYCVAVLLIRRLHDCNLSGWWVLGMFAPLEVGLLILLILSEWENFYLMSILLLLIELELIVFAVLLVVPGSPGVNRFGEPRATRRWEVWAAALLVMLLVVCWSVFAVFPYLGVLLTDLVFDDF